MRYACTFAASLHDFPLHASASGGLELNHLNHTRPDLLRNSRGPGGSSTASLVHAPVAKSRSAAPRRSQEWIPSPSPLRSGYLCRPRLHISTSLCEISGGESGQHLFLPSFCSDSTSSKQHNTTLPPSYYIRRFVLRGVGRF